MNREIKFRGKSYFDGRWIFGDLFHTIGTTGDGLAIQYYDDEDGWMTEDIKDVTVGQFTGFYDRKRLEIYEGDIITYLNHRIDGTGFIEQGKVEWRQEEGCYVFVNRFPTKDNRELVMPLIHCKEITVVGNIHDNPELLEGGQQ